QVVGAGFSVSEETGNVATFIKLLRVAMLLPVVMTLSFVFRAHSAGKAGRQLCRARPDQQPRHRSGADLSCAQERLALVSGDGHRGARHENVAQGDGGRGRARDRSDRRRNRVPRDLRVNGGRGAVLTATARAAPSRLGEPGWVRTIDLLIKSHV